MESTSNQTTHKTLRVEIVVSLTSLTTIWI